MSLDRESVARKFTLYMKMMTMMMFIRLFAIVHVMIIFSDCLSFMTHNHVRRQQHYHHHHRTNTIRGSQVLSEVRCKLTAVGPEEGEANGCGKCSGAPLCSGEYMDKGCDGEGRIQGGIALVLPWWPIKVFRPCPSYLQGTVQHV